MKEGTLVYHPEWGKGLVLKKLWMPPTVFPPAVCVLWNRPRTMQGGSKLTMLHIYEEELTILSEPEV